MNETTPAKTVRAQALTERKTVLVTMADRFNMEPDAFEATVRAQCSPTGNNARALTREEFAALLLVASQYKLNPITREIYAFPKRGGGVVPIVSIDGWISLVNTHPAFDGMEFEMEHGAKGALISCTCRLYRKDRSRPVEVTEYLSECRRDTDPWKMQHRMLRHKAMIQCSRYAFGFSGIYDEDEGRVIAEAKDITPGPDTPPPTPPGGGSDAPRPMADISPGKRLKGERTGKAYGTPNRPETEGSPDSSGTHPAEGQGGESSAPPDPEPSDYPELPQEFDRRKPKKPAINREAEDAEVVEPDTRVFNDTELEDYLSDLKAAYERCEDRETIEEVLAEHEAGGKLRMFPGDFGEAETLYKARVAAVGEG